MILGAFRGRCRRGDRCAAWPGLCDGLWPGRPHNLVGAAGGSARGARARWETGRCDSSAPARRCWRRRRAPAGSSRISSNSAVAPDIAFVARLGLAANPADAPARPLISRRRTPNRLSRRAFKLPLSRERPMSLIREFFSKPTFAVSRSARIAPRNASACTPRLSLFPGRVRILRAI